MVYDSGRCYISQQKGSGRRLTVRRVQVRFLVDLAIVEAGWLLGGLNETADVRR